MRMRMIDKVSKQRDKAEFQLRLVEIELGGWMENEEIPSYVAKEMLDRLMAIRKVLR